MKTEVKSMIRKIQRVLSSEPVRRAWLFGSWSRGEQGPDSDVDILVEMAPNQLTMLGFLKIQTRLEKEIHRPVDFIEDECLEDFARPAVDRDKILIYEAS